MPTPSATRVPATSMISGIVKALSVNAITQGSHAGASQAAPTSITTRPPCYDFLNANRPHPCSAGCGAGQIQPSHRRSPGTNEAPGQTAQMDGNSEGGIGGDRHFQHQTQS